MKGNLYYKLLIIRYFTQLYQSILFFLIFLNGIQLDSVFILLYAHEPEHLERAYIGIAPAAQSYLCIYIIYLYTNKILFKSKHLDPQCYIVLIKVFCFCFSSSTLKRRQL